MKILVALLIGLLQVGCVTYSPPVPVGYTGKLASVDDSYILLGKGAAEFFYLDRIDGKPIYNARGSSAATSSGQGMSLTASGYSRAIPTKPTKLTLTATVYFAAPIAALFSTRKNNHVSGEIDFTPMPDMHYVVKGTFEADSAAIWLEDLDGNIVSDTVEKKGDKIDIVTLKDATHKKLTKTAFFAGLEPGLSHVSVNSILGEPDEVEVHKANFFQTRSDFVYHKYEGLGRIIYASSGSMPEYISKVELHYSPKTKLRHEQNTQSESNGEGSDSTSKEKELVDFEANMRTVNADILSQVQSKHSPKINSAVMRAERIHTFDPALLQEFRKQINEGMNKATIDKHLTQAYARMLHILSVSSNPKNKELVQIAAQEAQSKKLKKYAKHYLAKPTLLPESVERSPLGIKDYYRSGDSRAKLIAVIYIKDTLQNDEQTLSWVTEELKSSYTIKKMDGDHLNALAHLVRYVGRSGDAQYVPLLDEIIENTSLSKLKRHARNAKTDLLNLN